MKHFTAETLVRNSISRIVPNPTICTTRNIALDLPAKLGTEFLTPDDVALIQSRYEQQGLSSSWYGFSLIGTPPARIVAVIVFANFGDLDHVMIARGEDGDYALASGGNTVLATSARIGRLLDLFDEHQRRR